MRQRLHGQFRAAEGLLALVTQQAIGIAHQLAGLLKHGTGLTADLGQLLNRGTNVATLFAECSCCLLQMIQGVGQAGGVVFGEQLVGVVHQHVDIGQQVTAVIKQASNR
ncbi:hypothetical protein D3C77_503440 [compost metagenome]